MQRAHDIILSNPEVKKIRQRKYLSRKIANSVAQARHDRGLTQAQLAEKLGTKQSSIARLEKGESIPSLVFLNRIAEALGDQLLEPTFASQSIASLVPPESTSKQVEYQMPVLPQTEKIDSFSMKVEARQ